MAEIEYEDREPESPKIEVPESLRNEAIKFLKSGGGVKIKSLRDPKKPKPKFEQGKILKEINDVIVKYGYDVREDDGVKAALATFMNNLYSLSL